MTKSIKLPNHSDLKQDHECFKEAIVEFKDRSKNIETFAAELPEIANTLKEMHHDSNEHLKLIAGKKQVPLSIFVMIVGLLSGLIVATEVKYSGVSIDIGWDHIKIGATKYEKPAEKKSSIDFNSSTNEPNLLKV